MQTRWHQRGWVVGLCLSVFLGLSGLTGVAADRKPEVKVEIFREFNTTLQPDELHGFALDDVSANRSYVVEITPDADDADVGDGASIESFVEPETNGSVWTDVLRVLLRNANDSVDVHIRIYALVVKQRH